MLLVNTVRFKFTSLLYLYLKFTFTFIHLFSFFEDYHNRTETEVNSDGFCHVSITKYRKDTIIPQIKKLIPCPEVVFLDYFSIPSGSITFEEQLGIIILSFPIIKFTDRFHYYFHNE